MADTQDQDTRWIAGLTPVPGTDIERLLQTPLGLDVWERNPDTLVVQAYEGQHPGDAEARSGAPTCTDALGRGGLRPAGSSWIPGEPARASNGNCYRLMAFSEGSLNSRGSSGLSPTTKRRPRHRT
jgi:hypothetical protein